MKRNISLNQLERQQEVDTATQWILTRMMVVYLILGTLYAYRAPKWISYTLLVISTLLLLETWWALDGLTPQKLPTQVVATIVGCLVINGAVTWALYRQKKRN